MNSDANLLISFQTSPFEKKRNDFGFHLEDTILSIITRFRIRADKERFPG